MDFMPIDRRTLLTGTAGTLLYEGGLVLLQSGVIG